MKTQIWRRVVEIAGWVANSVDPGQTRRLTRIYTICHSSNHRLVDISTDRPMVLLKFKDKYHKEYFFRNFQKF